MAYDGLLLDHDGVVVSFGDGEKLREAAQRALEQAGVSDPRPADVERMRVSVDHADLQTVSDRYGLDPATLWRYRDDAVEQALCAETTAGRKAPYDDVASLADVDVPMGVVSNNQTRIVEFILDHYDLAGHIETIHARVPHPESLQRKKPRPTYIEAAMADLGLENPLYVGDSETDVLAAQRAGVDAAYLRRDHNADQTLDARPTHEVETLHEVTAHLTGPEGDAPARTE